MNENDEAEVQRELDKEARKAAKAKQEKDRVTEGRAGARAASLEARLNYLRTTTDDPPRPMTHGLPIPPEPVEPVE